MSQVFDFDRIADKYSDQRAHPSQVSEQIGRAVMELVGTGAHLLEVGIGTGRIAHPVVRAGARVTGIDISAGMLRELGNQDTRERLSLVQADMHAMPFPNDLFDGVMAVHVLHLADDWRTVLTEIARVLRPGGLFIQGDDWIDPASCVGALRNQLRATVMELEPTLRPPAVGATIRKTLAELGGTEARQVTAAEWTGQTTPAQVLQAIAQRDVPEAWILSDELLEATMARLRHWAADQWPNLDAPQPILHRFQLNVLGGQWS